ncbi:MAG: alkaline phosphatase D family protein, partial [Deltaproteobacteria bacterium]|nr:alkaline phosphatase D family protein [Deltaproteobacteria bacterium]
ADIISMPKYRTGILEHMARSGAAAYISLGDWPYCDKPWEQRASTIDEFRKCHLTSRVIPQVRSLTSKMGIYGIYDDHEIRNDFDQRIRDKSPSLSGAGLNAWDEFFPMQGKVRYRSWRWGQLLEFFLLDLRSYRTSYKAPDGPGKTMMGAEQKRWLLDGLAASKASFRVVISSVPLGFGTTKEHWNAFPSERAELMKALMTRPKSTVVLTADQHWFAAHHHKGGLREFQVGPVMAFTRPPGPKAPEVVARSVEPNFGELRATPGSPNRLVFVCRDKQGKPIYSETLQA